MKKILIFLLLISNIASGQFSILRRIETRPYAPPANCSISFLQSKSDKNNAATFTTTPTTGNTVVVVVVQYGGSLLVPANITDNKGNVYLLGQERENAGANPKVQLFYSIGVNSSPGFTVSVATVPNYTRIFILEYSGIVGIGQTNSAEQDAQTFANGGSINTTINNSLVIMASANDEPNVNTLTITPGGSYVVRESGRDGGGESTGFVMDYLTNPIGSQTPSATLDHTLNSATVVVSFKCR